MTAGTFAVTTSRGTFTAPTEGDAVALFLATLINPAGGLRVEALNMSDPAQQESRTHRVTDAERNAVLSMLVNDALSDNRTHGDGESFIDRRAVTTISTVLSAILAQTGPHGDKDTRPDEMKEAVKRLREALMWFEVTPKG